MHPHRLFRSTPFRLALAFALLFVCAFLLSGFVTFTLIKNELDARYDSQTKELFQIISQTYGDSDIQDVIDATRMHIGATTDKRNIFLLQAADGKILAANVPPLSIPDGWSRRLGADFGVPGDFTYRVLAGKVGPDRLIVGTNNEETGELQEIVVTSFGWALLVVIALAIGAGALIASRAQRRLDAVRDTMGRVSHGELSARIPLLGRGDDVDLLSRDINVALERLSLAVESMRQVSTDIAHDLKTPLNHLRMTLEDASLKQANGEPVGSELELAMAEAGQIDETFEALLRIAQIESGARKSRFSSVDLSDVLSSLVEVYGDVAEDSGQQVMFEVEAGGVSAVFGDRELLTQMYANLIENSIRYAGAGAVIRLRLFVKAESVRTSVEDSGPGIPKDEHANVFRRLYRLEKSRTSPGTGLGLSLVKAIADLHGATIWLEDAAPGLRVVLTYPSADK
ncbi:MAG: HAMP domain-containing sensor histidine kinase [Pseudolabrys sp.]|jgi:signal transduction histidine kinase|nr:HAMP domain-containing sensor histidine kinase [Pseudolabrys sp.]